MALQLGALRDALILAGVPAEKANEAAEEVAGYENRLTRLTTLVQVALGILLLLLGSQAALWNEAGKSSGTLARIDQRLSAIEQHLTR
jgi:hypothetical protein